MTELIITEDNFHEYFKNIREQKPERGQIMARYTAMAEFIEGQAKLAVINLLQKVNMTEAAIQTMRKLASATEKDAIRVCKEICQDLASGLSPKQVEKKAYRYQIEFFYYTSKEYVPIDDPHWSIISIANLDEFLDIAGNKLKLKSRLVSSSEHQNT